MFDKLPPVAQEALSHVFRELVEVDERGTATRRRARMADVARTDAAGALVEALTHKGRLLVKGEGADHQPVVEVAHEALLRNWKRLADWIEDTRDDLRLLRQVRLAAAEWEAHQRSAAYLWPDERLKLVPRMIDRLHPDWSEAERAFLRPEAERLQEELDHAATVHQRRAAIGERLYVIGDPRPGVGLREDGRPDIVWCAVPAGKIVLEDRADTFDVQPFHIAKYPVTWVQYRAFVEAADGYCNAAWWEGLAKREEKPGEQRWKLDNHPAENVSWYDAVAFCRWLSARLGYEIRLPTEWEWQQAATGGSPIRVYPWGPEWEGSCANTYESGLSRLTAVGMYPQGASPTGALDMAGNVVEWCLNEYEHPKRSGLSGDAVRVVRGGSWDNDHFLARAPSRFHSHPGYRLFASGLRVVCAAPL